MSETAILNQPVAEVAAALPGAPAVLRGSAIDYRRGGAATLADAARAAGADPQAVAASLLAAARDGKAVPPALLRTPDLVAHVLERFHEGHRADLRDILPLAEKVERVHAGHPACPTGLRALLRVVEAELDQHMRKEEEILFPLLLRGSAAFLAGPIHCMGLEHDAFEELLVELERTAGGCVPPADACGTWRTLYARLGRFVDEAREHMHLENDVLFPRFARAADGELEG
ncbi:MAG TPA: DUF542 domain-containing protein [Azospirillaceae bacterium]|nr:DUF542 domain-containing protein [Azospirillaceae bacterium]